MNMRALNNIHSGSAPSLAGFSFDQHDGSQNFSQSKDVIIENKLDSGESNLMVTMLLKKRHELFIHIYPSILDIRLYQSNQCHFIFRKKC